MFFLFLSSVGCRLVFVPSQRDIHHHFIYPQPPFSLPSLSKDQAQVRLTTSWLEDSTGKINKCLSPGNYICSMLSAARHPGPGPLHPADRRGDLRPDLHRHPVPHGRRGDQLVRRTSIFYFNWAQLTLYFRRSNVMFSMFVKTWIDLFTASFL